MNYFSKISIPVLVCLFVFFSKSLCASDGVIEIYVSPRGTDENTGASRLSPVKTLERMKYLVADSLARGVKKINVEFGVGVYEGESLLWDLPARGAEIHVSGISDREGDVIFDGKTATGNFWVVRITMPSKEPIQTNLSISNITVQNYCEGISFGDYKRKASIQGNRLENISFRNIGTKYESKQVKEKGKCVAAVRLQGALDTTLKKLKFSNIENLPQAESDANRYGPLAIHAIYIADRSSNVVISDSEFQLFTGSPIRLRNRSDNVKVVDSKFHEPIYIKIKPNQRPYTLTAISQWNCTIDNSACATALKSDECPSRNLQIMHARIGAGLGIYNDETRQRGDPTCKDQKLLQDYRALRDGYDEPVK